MQTICVNGLSNLTFGHNVGKVTHKNMLELLKKMHAEGTFIKTADEYKGSAVCELSTKKMIMKTLKMPTAKSSPYNADEYVKKGQTMFKFLSDIVVYVRNCDGNIMSVFSDLKKDMAKIKRELSDNIIYALKNYDTPNVKKHVYTIRTTV